MCIWPCDKRQMSDLDTDSMVRGRAGQSRPSRLEWVEKERVRDSSRVAHV